MLTHIHVDVNKYTVRGWVSNNILNRYFLITLNYKCQKSCNDHTCSMLPKMIQMY